MSFQFTSLSGSSFLRQHDLVLGRCVHWVYLIGHELDTCHETCRTLCIILTLHSILTKPSILNWYFITDGSREYSSVHHVIILGTSKFCLETRLSSFPRDSPHARLYYMSPTHSTAHYLLGPTTQTIDCVVEDDVFIDMILVFESLSCS